MSVCEFCLSHGGKCVFFGDSVFYASSHQKKKYIYMCIYSVLANESIKTKRLNRTYVCFFPGCLMKPIILVLFVKSSQFCQITKSHPLPPIHHNFLSQTKKGGEAAVNNPAAWSSLRKTRCFFRFQVCQWFTSRGIFWWLKSQTTGMVLKPCK